MARVPLLASRVEQRAVIRFFWAKGLSTAEIHNEMQPVYGHKCFNLSVVKRWCRKFSNGRTSLVDNKRSGRHLAATDNDVVKKIDQFIRTDRRVSISDIVLYTGISRGSVHTVVHDHLKFHKVSARWVPRQLKPEQQAVRMIMSLDNLQRYNEEGEGMLERIVTGDETWVHHYQPESKQASMQWKHKDSPTPTKFKVVPSAGKVMATMFWDMKGVLLVEYQEHGRTVTAASYCSLLERLKAAIKNKRPGLLTRGVLLLHDNARPHTARLTLEAINNLGFELLPHPPCSPDLAPSDYHLFGPMKKALGGQKFASDLAVQRSVQQWIEQLATSFFATGIEKLVHRWDKCLNVFGGYVEK
jgi:histone-lysine N-methyltransferase SETMAR